MQVDSQTSAAGEPNQNVLHSVFFIEQICLVLTIQVVLINLLSFVFVPVYELLPSVFLHMRVSSACAALCGTLALFFSEEGRSAKLRRIGQVFATSTIAVAAVTLWLVSSRGLRGYSPAEEQGSLLVSPLAFLLLGAAILLIRCRDSLASRIADIIAGGLAILVLTLDSEFLFGVAHIPGSFVSGPMRFPTLVCLSLLTAVTILRRAEHGIFSVFLGSGIGGRISRIVAPILIAVPILREIGRSRLLDAHLVPAHNATAILTSLTIAVAFALLVVLTRVIDRMQNEMEDLHLRDALTGLYNFRGFNLFAEQLFRLARRTRQPFGILFIDMDNLKLINDQLGHSVGSVSLVETAKLLTSTFRETDVIGRLGGDEFVVAGEFNQEELNIAMERLRVAAASKTRLAGSRFSLSLSMGCACAGNTPGESLKSLVARADKAMYKEKRAKKRAAGEIEEESKLAKSSS
jgi:diguanylate cyclase (GGDEF)-like protein